MGKGRKVATPQLQELLKTEEANPLAAVDERVSDRETAFEQAAGAFAVAMGTLLGAQDEDETVELLLRVPDLQDASEERRRDLARWHHDLYPGLAARGKLPLRGYPADLPQNERETFGSCWHRELSTSS